MSLTAGKIEKPFGDDGERVRFGLFNFLEAPVTLSFKEKIAYIQFMDMRGLDNHEYSLTKEDQNTYSNRKIIRMRDDGVSYETQD